MANLTIKDIARMAGVSTTAVSFVLNNRPGVSDATRQKLREAISKELYSDEGMFIKQITKGFSTSFRRYLQGIAQAAEIPIE